MLQLTQMKIIISPNYIDCRTGKCQGISIVGSFHDPQYLDHTGSHDLMLDNISSKNRAMNWDFHTSVATEVITGCRTTFLVYRCSVAGTWIWIRSSGFVVIVTTTLDTFNQFKRIGTARDSLGINIQEKESRHKERILFVSFTFCLRDEHFISEIP